MQNLSEDEKLTLTYPWGLIQLWDARKIQRGGNNELGFFGSKNHLKYSGELRERERSRRNLY